MADASNVNEKSGAEKGQDELQHFLDIPVKITIQLANRTMKVRDILQLQQSSIIELPKSAGENVDILMNDRLVAYGEVLQLEGSTGIRVTDFSTIP
jgi:flagellar motor switch protein FliN/FliY